MVVRRRVARGVAVVAATVLASLLAVAPAQATTGCRSYPPTGHSVCGAILTHYDQLGGPAGFLGYPITNGLVNPDRVGRRSFFQHGTIYWSPGTGAWEIGGQIFDHWANFGYEAGPLGYPTSDELVNPDGVGRRNVFQKQNAHIYWSPTTGAWEIQGQIFDKWGTVGYEKSALGYPTTDEVDNTGTFASLGSRRNFFQMGAIFFNGSARIATWQPWKPPA